MGVVRGSIARTMTAKGQSLLIPEAEVTPFGPHGRARLRKPCAA